MMRDWLEDFSAQLWNVLGTFGAQRNASGLLALLQPVAPFNRSAILSPAVTIGALVTFLILSGVAVAALGALLTALIALYLLVVQVFGVSIEFNPFGTIR
jgi:hypothetical protein